jgi:hypothetical protein
VVAVGWVAAVTAEVVPPVWVVVGMAPVGPVMAVAGRAMAAAAPVVSLEREAVVVTVLERTERGV